MLINKSWPPCTNIMLINNPWNSNHVDQQSLKLKTCWSTIHETQTMLINNPWNSNHVDQQSVKLKPCWFEYDPSKLKLCWSWTSSRLRRCLSPRHWATRWWGTLRVGRRDQCKACRWSGWHDPRRGGIGRCCTRCCPAPVATAGRYCSNGPTRLGLSSSFWVWRLPEACGCCPGALRSLPWGWRRSWTRPGAWRSGRKHPRIWRREFGEPWSQTCTDWRKACTATTKKARGQAYQRSGGRRIPTEWRKANTNGMD